MAFRRSKKRRMTKRRKASNPFKGKRKNIPTSVKNRLSSIKTPVSLPKVVKPPTVPIPILSNIQKILSTPRVFPAPPKPPLPSPAPPQMVNPPVFRPTAPIKIYPKTKPAPPKPKVQPIIPGRGVKQDRGFSDVVSSGVPQRTRDIILGKDFERPARPGDISAMDAIRNRGLNKSRISTKEGLRAFDETDRRVRGVPGDRAFDDEVNRAELGLPIVSGDSPGDRALILAGEAIPPMPTPKDQVLTVPKGSDTIGSGLVNVRVKSDPSDAEILVNGRSVGAGNTPGVLNFSKKEILDNAKTITVQKTGHTNTTTYTIQGKMVEETFEKQVSIPVFDDIGIQTQVDYTLENYRRFGGGTASSFEQAGLNPLMQGRFSGQGSPEANMLARMGGGTAGGAFGYNPDRPGMGGSSGRGTSTIRNELRTITQSVNKFKVKVTKRVNGTITNPGEFSESGVFDMYFDLVGVKQDPDPIVVAVPELLVLTPAGDNEDGSELTQLYAATVNSSGDVQRIDSNTFKATEAFNITIQAADSSQYRIKDFQLLKGRLGDEDSVGFETIPANQLTLDVGGPMTLLVNFEKVSQVLTPSVRLSGTSFRYNLGNPQKIPLGYDGTNTDSVRFQLGATTIERTEESGIFEISKTMFKNGAGQYTGYVIPSNVGYGDGEPQRFNINVVNEVEVEEPDIVNISYPSLIKGADFRGYDVNFTIQYQSINTNFVNIYLGSKDNLYGKFSPNQSVDFNMLTVLKKIGNQIKETNGDLKFTVLLIPHNTSTSKEVIGKTEVLEITFDKSDLDLPRQNVIDDLCSAFEFDFNLFDDDTSKYLTHLAHFGKGDNKLIANWERDDVTFAEYQIDQLTGQPDPNIRLDNGKNDALVLKMYEPLPKEVEPNQELWISKIITAPIIDEVSIVDDSKQACIHLQGPNFGVNACGSPADTGYELIDELVSSGSTSSAKLINTFVSQSGIDTEKLDIEYVSSSYDYAETEYGYSVDGSIGETYKFENFAHFGSSEERARNFHYKVSLLEIYSASLDRIDSGSGSSTGSLSVVRERESIVKKQNDIKVNFDGFEKFLYNSTSSLAYPKESDGVTLQSTGSTDTVAWYDTLLVSSSAYDTLNENYLVNNIPEYIRNDGEQEDFVLFLDMIGHHFDILWAYTKALSKNIKIEEKKRVGISDDMLKHVLKNYSWIPHSSQSTKKLWEYVLGYRDSAQTSQLNITGKDYENTIWRRILNNLPYLLKHKGTKRGLSAVLSTYGVPSSLLTIMEFGGPRQQTSQTSTYTFDDRTSAVVMPNDEQNTKILVDWNLENDASSSSAVELRFKTSNQHTQSVITNEPYWNLTLEHQRGNVGRLNFSSSFGSVITESGSLFNDEFTNLVINTNFDSASTGDASASIELVAMQDFQGRIRMEMSSSTDFKPVNTINSYFSGSQLSVGNGFTGSLDEFRIWSSALSASVIRDHSFMPDKTSGNHVSSSTEDLEFRLDFENPENLNVSTSISNVAVGGGSYNVSYATASGFSTNTSYPYHFEVYDREVTAKVPSMGFGPADKFRFESSSLTGNLSYKQRVTKKAFDLAPQDSNRLGLFVSPTKELNMDIIKSLPDLSIDDYIGEPGHQYKDTYPDLDELRDYVFARYNLNIYEYINLIKYIDKSLFETVKQMIPARAKLVDGLLIEPHFLERSKEERKKPTGTIMTSSQGDFDVSKGSVVNVDLSLLQKDSTLNLTSSVEFEAYNLQYETYISESSTVDLDTAFLNYNTEIDNIATTNLESSILRNSGSTDGSFVVPIDTVVDAPESSSSELESLTGTFIGLDDYSFSNIGYGLGPVKNGYGQRIYRDKFNNYKKEDVRVWIIKKEKKFKQKINIDSKDKSIGTQVSESVSRFKTIVSFVPSASNEYWTSSLSGMVGTEDEDGTIVQVTAAEGILPGHYELVSEKPTALENLYFKGCKQTQATTLDGTPPVEVFTTNPNTLKVSDSGRGSGEPILEVE